MERNSIRLFPPVPLRNGAYVPKLMDTRDKEGIALLIFFARTDFRYRTFTAVACTWRPLPVYTSSLLARSE